MNLQSDNVWGCSPEILQALVEVNAGTVPSYGDDDRSALLRTRVSDIFETETDLFTVATGTACNALALSVATPPWGGIYCHNLAHAYCHEYGATELFSGGARMIPIPGPHGRFTAADLDVAVASTGVMAVPSCVTLTQATEAGTVYRTDEVRAIAESARRHGLVVHMDGARFANALAALGASPADLSWRAGVDILSLGATKNGALAAEAVVVFRRDLADTVRYRQTRGGHVFSKARFVAAQLDAYFAGDLWLRNARAANAAAAVLGEGLAQVPGVRLVQPVETNQVFADMPATLAEGLLAEGHQFFPWPPFGANVVRLVTGYATDMASVAAFVSSAARLAAT